MEIYERIRALRKEHLKLSQSEFAEKLGVTRSVINNIERNVLARPDQKEPFYRLICSTFAVNYDWLIKGSEPMFAETKADYINQLVQRYNGNDILKKVISAFIELDENERQAVLKFIDNLDPDPVQKVYIAAHSSNDEPPRIATMPSSEIQAALNDEPIKSDDDLK